MYGWDVIKLQNHSFEAAPMRQEIQVNKCFNLDEDTSENCAAANELLCQSQRHTIWKKRRFNLSLLGAVKENRHYGCQQLDSERRDGAGAE